MSSHPLKSAGGTVVSLAALLLWSSSIQAAGQYYVDGASSSCSDSGPGSSTAPYCTISAAAGARGGSGTTLNVRPAVYREQVTVPASGGSGNPFVFLATGPGVVVDGADDFGSTGKWSLYSGNVYLAASVTWAPQQVFADGTRLTVSTASPASLPSRTFEFVSGKGLYVNVGGGNPGLHQALVGRRTYGIRISSRSWVTFDGFTVTHTEDRGVYVTSSSNITLGNDIINYANGYGIHFSSCSSSLLASNTISFNNDHGILLSSGTTGVTIQDNESFQNARPSVRAANGLHLSGSSGNLFQRNRWHDNQDSGQHITASSNNNVSLQNRSWNNGDHGFDHLASTGTLHVGDVAWHNYKDGFSIEGTSPGTRVLDCIATDNGLTTDEFDLWVAADSTSGLVSNYNVFWNSTSQVPIKIGSSRYATISAFTAATGQDARSIQADPRFVNPGGGDLHLRAGSPAIDSADSSVPSWPATDAEGKARMDDPSTPNTGAGPVRYAERGALEFLSSNLAPSGTIDAPATDVTIGIGQGVTFSGTGSDPDGNLPLGFLWNFGGGAPNQTVEDPGTVVFSTAGVFTVTFTVTDSKGLADPTPATRQVTVLLPNLAPNGIIDTPTANPTITAGDSVMFTGTGSDPDGNLPFSFFWDFGGGASNRTVEDPGAVVFNTPGTYTVRFTVTDSRGTPDPTPDTRLVTVNDRAPNGVINTPAGNVTITAGGSVSFTGTWSDPDGDTALTFVWDFGGGAANRTVEDPGAVAFNTPGTYTVRFTVTDSLGMPDPTPDTRLITVSDRPPNGVIDTPAGNVTITAGDSVSFTGTGSDPDGDTALTFLWDFGGGAANRTVEDPGAVTFGAAGTYTVTFRVTDSLGLADPTPDGRVVTVTPPNRPPNGTIDTPATSTTITAGDSVVFAGTGTDPDGDTALTFLWDFGGGAPNQTAEDPGPVVFSTPGNYTITFTVTDSQSLADPTPDTRLVVVNPPPLADDEIHWTLTGPGSVAFDWRGVDDTIQYGPTSAYGQSVTGTEPIPLPFSSAGPFREARIDGLQPGTVYHYAVGAGPDHTFRPPPASGPADFTIYVEGDVSESTDEPTMAVVQSLIATGSPDFVLVVGDLSYANPHGQQSVDQHFNDLMTWSQDAAYMPAWGNHEWTDPTNACGFTCGETCPTQACDDLRNYKGRFALPNPQTSPDSPAISCCGEDWYWFDYGQVRFIAYPEPWSTATLDDWYANASALMNDAQSNPAISFIVTFGHRPSYSSGHHPGEPRYQSRLDALGAAYPKYVLNLNGHSHDYERTSPQSGVVHVTVGTGGFQLEEEGSCLWATPCGGACPCPPPSFSTFRAMHWGPLRLHFNAAGIEGAFICGPPGGGVNDVDCVQGSVVDSFTIPPAPPNGVIDTPSGNVTITAGDSVSFTGTGSDPNLYLPLSFTWDFDGGPPNQTVEDPGAVAFNRPGTYTVRFTVTNSQGTADPTPDTRVITVRDRPPNGAIDTPAANLTITAGDSVAFTGTASDPDGDAALSFAWDFGGGAPNQTVEDPGAVAFNRPGTYTVRFTVTDSLGTPDPTPDTRVITVNDRPPNGTIDTPAVNVTVTAGDSVAFTGTGSDPDGDPALTFLWDFGGGAANRTVEDPGAVVFNRPGTYTVRLTVTDSLGLPDPSPDTRLITVNDRPPNGVIDTPAGNVTVTAGDSVTFAGTASDPDGDTALTFLWDFGGGAANRTVEDPGAVAFSRPGTYTVLFTVTDSLGLPDPTPDVRLITVNDRPPNGVIDTPATGLTINAGDSVTFTGTGSDPDGDTALTFQWNFGGGAPNTTVEDPGAVVFSAPGTYTVTFTVRDSLGVQDPTPDQRVVIVNSSPNLVGNPSFETDATGWDPYSGSTTQRVSGGQDGAFSLEVRGPATTATFGINDHPNWVASTPAAGTHYLYSAWVMSSASTGQMKMKLREYQGITQVNTTTYSVPKTLSPAWQQITFDYFSVTGGSTIDFQIIDVPVAAGEVFRVDNISIRVIP